MRFTSSLLLSLLAIHHGTNHRPHTTIEDRSEGILSRKESGVRVAAKLRTNALQSFSQAGGSPLND
jgi:hypothetical protein